MVVGVDVLDWMLGEAPIFDVPVALLLSAEGDCRYEASLGSFGAIPPLVGVRLFVDGGLLLLLGIGLVGN